MPVPLFVCLNVPYIYLVAAESNLTQEHGNPWFKQTAGFSPRLLLMMTWNLAPDPLLGPRLPPSPMRTSLSTSIEL